MEIDAFSVEKQDTMAHRVVLIAVDDTDDDSRAMEWTVQNLLRPDGIVFHNTGPSAFSVLL